MEHPEAGGEEGAPVDAAGDHPMAPENDDADRDGVARAGGGGSPLKPR